MHAGMHADMQPAMCDGFSTLCMLLQDSLGKATTQKQKKKKPVVAGSKDDIFAQGRGKKRR